jgi:hypothetical protein
MARARPPLLIAILAWVLAPPLAAQHITSPYHFLDTHQTVSVLFGKVSTQTGLLGLGPESGNFYGARFGYRPSTGPLALELLVATAPLKREVLDTLRTGHDSAFARFGTADQGLLLVFADVRFNFTGGRTWHGLQPFALFGPGVVVSTNGQNGADRLVPQPSRFKFGTSFAAEVGAGVEWYATSRLGLRADARGVFWRLRAPGAFLAQNPTRSASAWARNGALSASLAFHF